jgi:hypothetical protein
MPVAVSLFRWITRRLASQVPRRWASTMTFSDVPKELPDPMQLLKQEIDLDNFPHKTDLGAGVYRDELGRYHEFDALKTARQQLFLIVEVR